MIHLENITKSFGNLQVLRGIDLEIEKGEIVSIVGPSGAGKTTLLQIMGTLDMPDGGSVVIDGTQVNRMREKELSAFRNRHIGFLFVLPPTPPPPPPPAISALCSSSINCCRSLRLWRM